MNLGLVLCSWVVNVRLVSPQMTFYYFSILIRHALSRFLLSSRITFSLLQIGTCFLFSFLQKSFLLIQAFNGIIIIGIKQQTEGTQDLFECKSIWLNLFPGVGGSCDKNWKYCHQPKTRTLNEKLVISRFFRKKNI